MDTRTVQRWLGVPADGIAGPKTYEAARGALQARAMAALLVISPGWQLWSNQRVLTAVKQIMLHDMSIDAGIIDGLQGPQFDHAVSVWQDRVRDVTPLPVDVAHQPTQWPRQASVPSFYGQPGQNQRMLECPYPMKLAWDQDTTINRFSIHEKVHDSALRVFTAVLAHYGHNGIEALGLDLWGGCLNVRTMRGGSSLSMHSWGIAIDIDPERNQLRWGSDKAWLARPPYNAWWAAWEAEGWISLGRERNYDWMHVQAARL